MTINIQSPEVNVSDQLTQFIEQKVEKLSTYHNNIIDADVFLNMDTKGNSRNEKTARILINIPGNQLVASETSFKFEESVVAACDHLRRQIKKHKTKLGQR